MEIKCDFYSDWIEILKEVLEKDWGYDTSGLNQDQIAMAYFNAEFRRVSERSRKVFCSDVFLCPPDLEGGWKRLKRIFERGENVLPNLSKFTAELSKTDAMLNDWGIHHFHLGENFDKKSKGQFIKRTGPLLFARVTDSAVYAIGIYKHGVWTDDDLIETMHRNWPELLRPYALKGLSTGGKITEEQRKTLRRKHANACVVTSDGTRYGMIGGGIAANGDNVALRVEIDRNAFLLKDIEKLLVEKTSFVQEEMQKEGHAVSGQVNATLHIEDGRYYAIFPEYSFGVEIPVEY